MTPCRGATSEAYTRWVVLKLFIVRDLILNLTMIVFVDLPLYGRELVGEFGGNFKMKCQRFNINVIIIDFLEVCKIRC